LAKPEADAAASLDLLQAKHDRLERERDATSAQLAANTKRADALAEEHARVTRERDQLSANVLKLNEEHRSQVEILNEEIKKHAAATGAAGTQATQAREHAQAELARAQADTARKLEALEKERTDAQRQRDALAADVAKFREEIQKHSTQAASATRDVAVMREELDKLNAERANWEKELAAEKAARGRDAEALRQARESLAGADDKTRSEIARIESAHHNAATALADERKRIEAFRDQINDLRREKKLEMNAMAQNFHTIMHERDAATAALQQELAHMREQVAAAATREAEARESAAQELAELRRRLEETNLRLAAITADRDTLKAQRDEMLPLPTIRPMTLTPPGIGNQPPE